MLLSAARLRVLKLVDDAAADVYDTSEVADALLSGQVETWRIAQGAGPNIFNTTTTFTSSAAGVVDLTSVKPARILNVSSLLNGARMNVRAFRIEEAPSNYATSVALSILHVPDAVFPAAEPSAFVWGNSGIATSTEALLNSLMILIAALELKPKEAELLAGLQARKDEKEELVASLTSVPGWAVHPMDISGGLGRIASYGYIMTAPHTLQLVI